MVAVVVLLAALTPQMLIGDRNDLLMRPVIPDYSIVNQTWVTDELGFNPDELSLLAEYCGTGIDWGEARIHAPAENARKPLSKETLAQYRTRILQLSIWAWDIQALTNRLVADKIGLSGEQRQAIDARARKYFKWFDEHSEHLLLADGSHPRLGGPDEMLVLEQLVELRKDLRTMVTPSQVRKLCALRGRPPHTTVPFGFLGAANINTAVAETTIICDPRVQEELGFTMRQSRLFRERQNAARGDFSIFIKNELNHLTIRQQKRLRELQFQMIGAKSLLFHDAMAQVGISPDKMDEAYLKLARLAKEDIEVFDQEQRAYQAASAAKSRGGTDLERLKNEYDSRRRAIRLAGEQAILDTLTVTQQKRWERMQGSIVIGLRPKWMD